MNDANKRSDTTNVSFTRGKTVKPNECSNLTKKIVCPLQSIFLQIQPNNTTFACEKHRINCLHIIETVLTICHQLDVFRSQWFFLNLFLLILFTTKPIGVIGVILL